MQGTLTLKDAAKRLGICPDTFRALVDAGKIRYVWIGRRRRITEKEIERILQHGTGNPRRGRPPK